MNRPPEWRRDGANDPTSLFEEYLDRWVDGDPLPMEELERRAGARAEELRGRLGLLTDLSELAELLQDEPARPPAELERVGRYEILHLLDESGSSRVYLAHDPELARQVALKVLKPEAMSAGEAREWTRREGRALAQLQHESIVRVYETGECEGLPFLVMELVRGPNLCDVLAALRAPDVEPEQSALPRSAHRAARSLDPLAVRCRLVERLARALHACHRVEIVHRDVKPGNVLLDLDHTPKLIDFGLAHHQGGARSLQVTQRLFGTLPYLAPEQIEKGSTGASPASDQYSLGVLFYELLTLHHPFVRDGVPATWNAVARAEVAPPRTLRRDVPADVERIVMHCLERDPARRYPSTKELADDIAAFLDHRAISLPEPSLARRTLQAVLRHRVRTGVAFVVGVALAWLAGSFLVQRTARVRLLDSLRASLARAEASDVPEEDFGLFFGELLSARALGERSDAALLSGLGLTRIVPEVDALHAAGSARFHQILDGEYEDMPVSSWTHRQEERGRALFARWNAAATLEERSAADGTCASPYHHPGTIEVPPGGELLRFGEALPEYPELVPASADEVLKEGLYRLRFRDGLGPCEVDLFGYPFRPRMRVDLPRRLVELRGRAVRCEGGFYERTEKTDAKDPYEVHPFLILSTPVTWLELRHALGAAIEKRGRRIVASRAGIDAEEIPLDGPAVVPGATALMCATELGARLPTPIELRAALRSGAVEPAEGCVHEWTSGFFPGDVYLRFRMAYDSSSQKDVQGEPWPEMRPLLIGGDGDSWESGVCFRLVFPLDE